MRKFPARSSGRDSSREGVKYFLPTTSSSEARARRANTLLNRPPPGARYLFFSRGEEMDGALADASPVYPQEMAGQPEAAPVW